MPAQVVNTLSKPQDVFINSDLKKVAMVAGKGAGKTWSGARFLLRQVSIQPKEQHLMMLNTLGQARDIYYQDVEPLLEELNWPHHFNEQYGNLKIFNTTVHVRSAEKDSVKRIESISYASGWADEASFYNPNSFNVFRSRIRKGLKQVRVTSMPDDPEHWMYPALEKANFKLYELGLKDNPDKQHVEDYTEILRSIYDEVSLRRFLDGERVSLAGIGLFNVHPEMKQRTPIDPNEDLYLFWDFNVEYRAVSGWQKIAIDEKGRAVMACVKSWKMGEGKQQIVYDDATQLAEMFSGHKARIYLGGDATEDRRTVQSTESAWVAILRAFREAGIDFRSIVPSSNPNPKDTIQCSNWALGQGLVVFDTDEKFTYSSMQAAKADKYGEIDKSVDQKKTGPKTHFADTGRYGLWYFYKDDYPGGTSKVWVV